MTAINKQTVKIKLGKEIRDIEIQRYTEKHCWHASVAIVVKFPTGEKLHTLHNPQVIDQKGIFSFPIQTFRNRNRAIPFAWADSEKGNSGWTRNIGA